MDVFLEIDIVKHVKVIDSEVGALSMRLILTSWWSYNGNGVYHTIPTQRLRSEFWILLITRRVRITFHFKECVWLSFLGSLSSLKLTCGQSFLYVRWLIVIIISILNFDLCLGLRLFHRHFLQVGLNQPLCFAKLRSIISCLFLDFFGINVFMQFLYFLF